MLVYRLWYRRELPFTIHGAVAATIPIHAPFMAKAKKRLSSLEKLMQRCLGATGSEGAKERELAEKIKTIVHTEEENSGPSL
ncbi:hypothetical protein NFJ02_18g31780 [Pycnococcus provasolii]